MSGQPKPTTHGKPKKGHAWPLPIPTTGEWTAETVCELGIGKSWQAIADAHNAAIHQPKPHHCKIDYNPDTDQVIFTVTENANQPTGWTVDEHGKLRSPTGERFDNVHHPEHLKDAINAAIYAAAVRSIQAMEKVQQQVNDMAHQLAAEREKTHKTERALIQSEREVQQLREELAAEREAYVKQREDWIREIQQLQQHLATERDISSAERKNAVTAIAIARQLREQLATAQASMKAHNERAHKDPYGRGIDIGDTTALDSAIAEAHSEGRRKQAAYEVEHHQKPLVDALTKIATSDFHFISEAISISQTALAKVKEGK